MPLVRTIGIVSAGDSFTSASERCDVQDEQARILCSGGVCSLRHCDAASRDQSSPIKGNPPRARRHLAPGAGTIGCHPKQVHEGRFGAAGASPEAVAFAKSLADKGYGYLRDFRAEGRVDVAYVEYFLGANELEGVLLVNGSPPILDVDDVDLFPSDEVAKNDSYRGLLQRYPKLGVFPGDRFHTDVPVAKSLGGRGQEFIVSYVLRDGCHACAVIGELRLAFDFDADGTFTGVQVLEVTSHIQSTAKYLFRETEQAVVLAF